MANNRMIIYGLIGTVVAALCCFTPVLVLLFALLGISALTSYVDMFLLPLLGLFILITLYALWKRNAV